MRSSRLVTFSAACFLAGVEAVKTKQSMWWVQDEAEAAAPLQQPLTVDSDDWWTVDVPVDQSFDSIDESEAVAQDLTSALTMDTVDADEDFTNLFFMGDEEKAAVAEAESAAPIAEEAPANIKIGSDLSEVLAGETDLPDGSTNLEHLLQEDDTILAEHIRLQDDVEQHIKQEDAREAAEDAAIRLAEEEAARIEAQRKAAEEAKAAKEAHKVAIEEEARLKAEQQAQIDAQKLAEEEAVRQEAAREEAEKAAEAEVQRAIAEQAAREELARQAEENVRQLEAQRKAAEDLAARRAEAAKQAEQERLAAIEAARVEAEKRAAAEAARIEAERIAADEAARIEAERKAAAQEAVRQEEERKAQIEAERLAQQEAARLETERIAAEQEAMRLAAEEAARMQLEKIVAKQEAAISDIVEEEKAETGSSELETALESKAQADEDKASAVEAALKATVEEAAPAAVEEEVAAPAAEESTDLSTLLKEEAPASPEACEVAAEVADSAVAELAEIVKEETGASDEVACEFAAEVVDAVIDEAVEKVCEVVEETTDATEEQAETFAEATVAEVLATEDASLCDLIPEEEAAPEVAPEVADEQPEVEEEPACMLAAKEEITKVCQEQGADEETASDIAAAVVQEAACELADAGADEEQVGLSVISTALFDLTAAEVVALQEMEDDIIEEQFALAEIVATSEDPFEAEKAMQQIEALESKLGEIVAAEEAIVDDFEAETEDQTEAAVEIPDLSTLDEERLAEECAECTVKYEVAIEEATADKQDIQAQTDEIAEALAEIDPNTMNAAEGTALIRKIYKLKGIEPEEIVPVMPETPEDCVPTVAGKVIMLEQLEEDVTKALSFRDFFADVYCMAYVNSLVTMTDGLSQIFPGGLDWQIEDELQRLYGPFSEDQMDMVEIGAVESYMLAIESGDFANDDSTLIDAVEPLMSALDLCDPAVVDEIEGAKQDREDYLYDYNFLRFLRDL